jgi:DNA polymerase III alpha subunit
MKDGSTSAREPAGGGGIDEPQATLPPISPLRSIIDDYASLGLSLDRHPVGCVRQELDRRGIRPAVELDDPRETPDGCRLGVAGVVLVRQRPSTAGGIVFMTLEDETGIANLVLKPRIYRRHRAIARHAVAMLAFGRVERRGDVVHLVVTRVEPMPTSSTVDTAVTHTSAQETDDPSDAGAVRSLGTLGAKGPHPVDSSGEASVTRLPDLASGHSEEPGHQRTTSSGESSDWCIRTRSFH